MVLAASIRLLVLSVSQPAQGEPKRPEPVVRAWVNDTPLFDDDFRPARLEEAVFKLVSPLVETDDGVHVVRMIEHRSGGLATLNEELRAEIGNQMRSAEFERERKQFIDDLRSRAMIYVVPDAPFSGEPQATPQATSDTRPPATPR